MKNLTLCDSKGFRLTKTHILSRWTVNWIIAWILPPHFILVCGLFIIFSINVVIFWEGWLGGGRGRIPSDIYCLRNP